MQNNKKVNNYVIKIHNIITNNEIIAFTEWITSINNFFFKWYNNIIIFNKYPKIIIIITKKSYCIFTYVQLI